MDNGGHIVCDNDSGGLLAGTFEVILYESGDIVFNYDLSFTENSFNQARSQLERDPKYKKIYWSQTFSIYIK